MDIHLPKGLVSARPKTQGAPDKPTPDKPMYILSNGTKIHVLDRWAGGFSTSKQGRPLTRGIVDLFVGSAHVSHGLAYLAADKPDMRVYAFKTATDPSLSPPIDHVRRVPVPAGLITQA